MKNRQKLTSKLISLFSYETITEALEMKAEKDYKNVFYMRFSTFKFIEFKCKMRLLKHIIKTRVNKR